MKKGLHYPLIFALLLTHLTPLSVFAAEFNPNHLISDQELQDYTSMTKSDINLFLDQKGSYLHTYRSPDKDGKKRAAADIIYQAAHEYKINPKYLLVKLQKEQSLISATSPTKKQLDWATGYGICDACSMDDPKLQKYRGFGNQVDSAAGIMRWYYDNEDEQNWIKTAGNSYTIDGQKVTPTSDATAFLYTYTPHIQGNKNFWNLWQKWFQGGYPDGTLFKSAQETTIYLLENGKKRAFKSMTALITRFDPKRVIVVPEGEMSRYPLGTPISFPNFSVLKDGSKYYLLDDDTLRPFDSAATVKKIGYNPDEFIDVNSDDIADMPIGDTITYKNSANPLGEVLFIKETQSWYFIKNGISHAIIDPQVNKIAFPALKGKNGVIEDLQDATAGDPIKFPDGTLLKTPTSPKIYVVEHGKKRHITTEKMFLALGYQWSNVVTTNELMSSLYPLGSAIALPDSVASTLDQETSTNTTNTTTTKPTAVQKTFDTVKKGADGLPLFVDTGMMYAMTATDTSYVGKQFDTNTNTYLVADVASGKVLAGKNIDVVRPLASFTKVMTATLLMKKNISLIKSVAFNSTEHKGMYGSFRLVNGEKVKNADLLSTMLVSSNNTASRMIVDGVEKNETTFIKDMNALGKLWGLKQTRFSEPSGADLGNISTAREYLKIFTEATKNKTLLAYMGKKSYTYEETLDTDNMPTHSDSNSNLLMKRTDLPFTILASKTGYLVESGSGLAMLVERKSDNKQFMIITMGNPDFGNRFVEPERLTEWALKNF